jgi:arsenate reductase
MKTKILILCTGNSCRSQMAEGMLKSFSDDLEVYSAGVNPAFYVHPLAIKVMSEIGIDIKNNFPKNVDVFLNEDFDFVITVCDHAKETCPFFSGKVGERLHIGFIDPAETVGTEENVLNVFRKVRDEMFTKLFDFYKTKIQRV